MESDLLNDLEADGFGHWLAGFIDGEGCFHIHSTNGRRQYGCRLTVWLREDDRAILETVAIRTGVGSVTRADRFNSERPNDKPRAAWQVVSKPECVLLVHIFDRFPLRAKKARDYAIWRDAVNEWTRRHPYGRDWAPMIRLKRQLETGRVFSAPDSQPSSFTRVDSQESSRMLVQEVLPVD